MLCSVIILNWNGEDCLRQFLPSVLQYTTVADSEVVVADNGSTDNSIKVVEQLKGLYSTPLRTVKLDKNYGFADGYNHAIDQIRSKYVVLLNSDVEVTQNWLEPVIDYLEDHADVVACQPKILAYKSKNNPIPTFEYAGAAGGYVDRFGYPYCRGRVLNKVEQDKGQYDSIAEISWASGACLICRTEEYRKAGGLDGRFFAHMEEIDLCWRWKARGQKIMCIPQSIVWHVGGASLNYKNPKKTYLNFRNNALMLYKNLECSKYFFVMPLRYLLDLLTSVGFIIKGEKEQAKAIKRAYKDFRQMRKDYKSERKSNISQTINHNYLQGLILVKKMVL